MAAVFHDGLEVCKACKLTVPFDVEVTNTVDQRTFVFCVFCGRSKMYIPRYEQVDLDYHCYFCRDSGLQWFFGCGNSYPFPPTVISCHAHGGCVHGSRIVPCACDKGKHVDMSRYRCTECNQNALYGSCCFECGAIRNSMGVMMCGESIVDNNYVRCPLCTNQKKVGEACSCGYVTETYQSDAPPESQDKQETWRDRPPLL